MWLLKLHFSISVLCLLAFLGIREVYKDTIKENGYKNNGGKKASFWLFFATGINILMVITILLMAGMKKNDLEKKLHEMKNRGESGVDE